MKDTTINRWIPVEGAAQKNPNQDTMPTDIPQVIGATSVTIVVSIHTEKTDTTTT